MNSYLRKLRLHYKEYCVNAENEIQTYTAWAEFLYAKVTGM
jgi:hypothetical protein